MKTFEIFDDFKSFEKMATSHCGRLAARAYPTASVDDLSIVSDWNCWLMAIDDKCDEQGLGRNPDRLRELHERCIKVLQGASTTRPDIPLTRALRDIRNRLCERMPETWMARFTHSVTEYFEANQWEARNRSLRTWPTTAAYIQLRPFTGALYTVFNLIELTERTVLPVEVRTNVTIRELMRLAGDVVCWHNDIASLDKEQRHGDIHNLALVLNKNEDMSLQEAVDKVAQLSDEHVRNFIALAKTLESFGSPEVDEIATNFVAGLRLWMRANYDWSLESTRFSALVENKPISIPAAMPA